MSATKEMWINEVELICEDFSRERLDFEEAKLELVRLGFNADEAEKMLHNEVA